MQYYLFTISYYILLCGDSVLKLTRLEDLFQNQLHHLYRNVTCLSFSPASGTCAGAVETRK